MAEARSPIADPLIVWLMGRAGGEAQVQALEPLKKPNGSPLRLCLTQIHLSHIHYMAVKEFSAPVVRRMAGEGLSDGWWVVRSAWM